MDDLTEIIMKESLAEEAPPVATVDKPVTGMEVISRLVPGTHVVRGPDWKWGDQVSLDH